MERYEIIKDLDSIRLDGVEIDGVVEEGFIKSLALKQGDTVLRITASEYGGKIEVRRPVTQTVYVVTGTLPRGGAVSADFDELSDAEECEREWAEIGVADIEHSEKRVPA